MLLTPGTAKLVAQAAQDWHDPVEMRFIYDKEGRVAVGWNREELEMRKGLRPRPAPMQAYLDKKAAEQGANMGTLNFSGLAGLSADQFQEMLRQHQQTIPQGTKPAQTLAEAAAIQQLTGKAHPFYSPEKPKPPEPEKPDPSSPKFVLKRPKPV